MNAAIEPSKFNTDRQAWMSILARADFDDLQERWSSLSITPSYSKLRPAEIGMVMVRARVNGSGSSFNMGEATATRCSVQMASGEVGASYILGRNKSHATLAAVIDGEMQRGEFQQKITEKLLAPLQIIEQIRQQKKQVKATKTKVDFFTLARGED